jgi:hypothetical protein
MHIRLIYISSADITLCKVYINPKEMQDNMEQRNSVRIIELILHTLSKSHSEILHTRKKLPLRNLALLFTMVGMFITIFVTLLSHMHFLK